MHALIMEADAFVAFAIEETLREYGFTSFAFATTGDEAFAAAEERCPDLITADKNLQTGCGIEAVQRICSGKPIPVVFVSEDTHAIESHFRDPITVRKPFPSKALSGAIGRAIMKPVPPLSLR